MLKFCWRIFAIFVTEIEIVTFRLLKHVRRKFQEPLKSSTFGAQEINDALTLTITNDCEACGNELVYDENNCVSNYRGVYCLVALYLCQIDI